MATDLDAVLQRAWDQFVRTGAVPRGVRHPIASSWLRCRQMGLDPMRPQLQTVPPEELQRRLAAWRPLIDLARPFLVQLVSWQRRACGPGVLAVLADADGVLLDVVADRGAAGVLAPGQRMTEDSLGTSAVGLALLQRRPATVAAAEHYCRILQPFTAAAVPAWLPGHCAPVILGIGARGPGLDDAVRGLLAESAAALAGAWHAYQRSLHQQALLGTHCPWPLLAVDGGGRVVDCNPAAERELGRAREELIGRTLAEVGAGEALGLGAEGRAREPRELVVHVPSGDAQVFLAESAPLAGDAALPGGRVIAGVNITGYRQQEEHAQHQQRLALVERLASLAVHEIRNPLAAIRVTAELAAMTPHSERRTALMEQIIASIDELEGFLAELLALASPGQMQRAPMNVGRVIQRVVQLFEPQARSAGVVLRVRGLKHAPAVMGNEQLLRHALINLTRNALQAMPNGGAVTIRVEHRPARRAVLIRISDTGTGIPPGCRRRLFTGAVTTKGRHGAGLGLMFTHRIVTETHGGRIWFRTREGAGTTFYIQLPVAPPQAAAPPSGPRAF